MKVAALCRALSRDFFIDIFRNACCCNPEFKDEKITAPSAKVSGYSSR
jgi:hypothetical protein